MRPRLAFPLLGAILATGVGAGWWWSHRPEPPKPEAVADKKYEDVDRDEYEKWMQELGYTE